MSFPNPFKHQHAMKPVSCQCEKLRHRSMWGLASGEPEACTIILLRCAGCGHVESKVISGSWTLAELCGAPHDDSGAVERLLKGSP